MNNKPIIYEDKMKYRDNEFLYDKCVKQYHQLMLSQDKNKEYKNKKERQFDYAENVYFRKDISEARNVYEAYFEKLKELKLQ